MTWRGRGTTVGALACAALFAWLCLVTVRQDGAGVSAVLLGGPSVLFLAFAGWFGPKAWATWEVRIDPEGIRVTRLWGGARVWAVAPGQLWQYAIDGTSEGEAWLTLACTDGRRIRAPVGMADAADLAAALDSALGYSSEALGSSTT